MNSLSPLQHGHSHGVRSNESGLAQSLRKLGETTGAMTNFLEKGSELMQRRVENLSEATTQMASDFIGQFAQQLFGDQAKGMTIEFDQMALSAESSFTAIQQSSQSAQGSSQASAFRLTDASHFSGKGTLTTADGQRFDIEIDIRYESVIEGASIARQINDSNASKAIPNGQTAPVSASTPIASSVPIEVVALPRQDDDKQAKSLNQNFAGTAMDLLKRLTSEPVFRPFSMLKPAADGKEGLQLLGEMALQLLNLPGGPRHLDMSPDHDPHKKAVDAKA